MRLFLAIALAACTPPKPNFADAGMFDGAVRDGGHVDDDGGLDAGMDGGTCRSGLEECGGTPCDTYTWADEDHCGECDTVCDADRLCIAGACRLPEYVKVAASPGHTCVLTGVGHVLCWGRNGSGELGDGHVEDIPGDTDRPEAVAVLDIADAVDLVAAGYSNCAIRGVERVVSCWGDEGFERFGDPDAPSDSHHQVPVSLFNARGVLQVALGGSAQLCVRTATEVLCTGDNLSGALGQLDEGLQTQTPVAMPLPSGLPVDIAAGGPSGAGHTCVVMDDGFVYCTGDNSNGQCGQPFGKLGQDNLYALTRVDGPTDVVDVEAGAYFTCARSSTGIVWCWGTNSDGELGRPMSDPDYVATEVAVPPMGSLALGSYFVIAVTTAGDEVWTWGEGDYGMQGRMSGTEVIAPGQLMRTMGFHYQASAGSGHACLLVTTDGSGETEVRCAGDNDNYQLGNPEMGRRSSTFTPVDALIP